MSYSTIYSIDGNYRTLKGFRDLGGANYILVSRQDPLYLDLLTIAQVPFDYVSPPLLYTDPRIINFGHILTRQEFENKCDPVSGTPLNERPTTSKDWIAAYLTTNDVIVAYTTDNQRFNLHPVDNITDYEEVESITDYLFGGRILSEWEALIYEIDSRYYDLPEDTDNPFLIEIPIDIIGEGLHFIYGGPDAEPHLVNDGFTNFVELSASTTQAILDSQNKPLETPPTLVYSKTTEEIWVDYYTLLSQEGYKQNFVIKAYEDS